MDQAKALVLSIKPKFANRILLGEKKVELRRVKPNIDEGDMVIIYVTSPEKSIKAIFRVGEVIIEEPKKLWEMIKDDAGISKKEYENYFLGAEVGFAIGIADVNILSNPIALSEIREIIPGFSPPQSYRYFSNEDLTTFMNTMM